MRTFRLALLTALTALAFVGCKKDDDDPARPSRVTFLFTTDEHSHLFAFGNEGADWPLPYTAGDGSLQGGIARRATILNAQRTAATQRGGESVVVSSGDWSQGTLAAVAFTTNDPDLGLMRAVGYEVVALGNHEFELGPAALAAAVNASVAAGQAPPLVMTNLAFSAASSADDALAALYGERGSGKAITRSRIHVTQRGIRIGFVSDLGFDASRGAAAAAPVTFGCPLTPATTADGYAACVAGIVQAEVDSLRAEGVDAVVLLGHGGVSANPAVPGDDERLTKLLSGVDLVLAGHTHLQKALQYIADKDGFDVPLLAAPALGRAVGKVELMLHGGGRPTVIEDQTEFLPVDSTTAPTASPTVREALTELVAGVEAAFLPGTLSLVEGAPVADDPAVAGDLYFRELCSPSFPIVGLRQPGETNALNLDTDAMRAVLAGIGQATEIAIQNSGSMRADFFAGGAAAGDGITMADVYRMAPLGGDPTTGTPGYPLVRAYMTAAELRAAFEGTLPMAYPLSPIYSPDYYLSPAGLKVKYDPSRPPLDPTNPLYPVSPGWTTYVALVAADGTETPLYDATVDLSPTLPPGWLVNPADRHSVVTTYYVASFATYFGLHLYADATTPTPLASLADVVVKWPVTGSPTVKDHQVLGKYIYGACSGGDLPPIYDESNATYGAVPRRVLCEGPYCL
jgi:2',3'-cyclic-nucleotide 2'-phosphodiesterase (5'-nucleotidase family)